MGLYEPGLQGVELNLAQIGLTTYTQASGFYTFPVNAGNYLVTAPQIPNWVLTSDSLSYTCTVDTASKSSLNFGYKPTQQLTSLQLSFDEGSPGCIWETNQRINLKNNGTVPIGGLITYLKHDSVEVIATFPPADSIIQQVYYWNYLNLVPFGIHQIELTVDKPNTAGYQFHNVVYGDARSLSGQVIVSMSDTVVETVLCSYDPNDKLVAPVTIIQGQNYTQLNENLVYTIRFQNTGNAPAVNVTIIDTLPSVMDAASFSLISVSHPVDVHVSAGGIVTFNFYNINLPDSISNELGSHGFLTFNLSPLAGLSNFTVVENNAHIFFDQNSPIVTNTSQTTYVTNFPIGLNDVVSGKVISIYPNPAGSTFTIHHTHNGLSGMIKVHSALGSELISKSFSTESNSMTFDCSELPSGLYLVRVMHKGGNSVMKLLKK
ncbi:MAG: T9SS type A sorting domain-containing protein [Bacteroidota bacterium]|nr:T9SS type A sorting domain-containing protein [Bacteroidota bacterium]